MSLLFIKLNRYQVTWSKTPPPRQLPSVPLEKKLELGGYGVSRRFARATSSLLSPQPGYSCSGYKTFPETSSESRDHSTERPEEEGLTARGTSCQGKGGDREGFRWREDRVVQGEGRWAHLDKDSAGVWKKELEERRQTPRLKSSQLQIQTD